MHVRVEPAHIHVPDDTEARNAVFTISTGARDSHRTVLNPHAWDLQRYHRNPIVGYQHEVWGGGMCYEPNPDMIIGTSRVTVQGERDATSAALVADATFEPREINELAEKIWRKIQFGSMRATSVGFMEIGEGKWGDDEEARDGERPTYYFASQELYEWSVVNMGSNPETVKRDANRRARAFVARAVASMRQLGENVSVDDVMRMRVEDALLLFDGTPHARPFKSPTRAEKAARVAEFIRTSL